MGLCHRVLALLRRSPITNPLLFSLFMFGSGEGDLVGAAAGAAAQASESQEVLDETAVADLVRQAANGRADSFGRLYDLYLDRIYRYVYYRVGNAVDAEDLTEDIFLKAWEALPGYRVRGVPFVAWLYRLAHNRIVDARRTRKEVTELLEIVPSRDCLPDDVVARKLDAEALRAVLSQLTEEQREVVVLKFIDGLSTKETAEVMGRQEGAVRALQMRALQSLRRLVDTRGPGRSVDLFGGSDE